MWPPLFADFAAAMHVLGASRFELPAEVLADLARRYPANERLWRDEHEAVGDKVEAGEGQLTFWGLFGGVRWGRVALAMLVGLGLGLGLAQGLANPNPNPNNPNPNPNPNPGSNP